MTGNIRADMKEPEGVENLVETEKTIEIKLCKVGCTTSIVNYRFLADGKASQA